jgi:AhpC/TSA family
LRKKGIGLAAVSYDSREILADFSRRHRITYPLLSDVGSATIRRYGILNTVVDEALGPNGKDRVCSPTFACSRRPARPPNATAESHFPEPSWWTGRAG